MDSQCPVCFSVLEIRDVTPCHICGAWNGMVEAFAPDLVFEEWRLPGGAVIILCDACKLEEFMVPGGCAERLGLRNIRLAINDLQFVRTMQSPKIGKDKFCPSCNLRLAFLKLLPDAVRKD
jgi:hypothetical protein